VGDVVKGVDTVAMRCLAAGMSSADGQAALTTTHMKPWSLCMRSQ